MKGIRQPIVIQQQTQAAPVARGSKGREALIAEVANQRFDMASHVQGNNAMAKDNGALPMDPKGHSDTFMSHFGTLDLGI